MNDDTISRQAVVALVEEVENKRLKGEIDLTYAPMIKGIKALPSARPEITYQTCSDALLKMWMDNVLTDGEYNRIMDKLNAWKGNPDADHD